METEARKVWDTRWRLPRLLGSRDGQRCPCGKFSPGSHPSEVLAVPPEPGVAHTPSCRGCQISRACTASCHLPSTRRASPHLQMDQKACSWCPPPGCVCYLSKLFTNCVFPMIHFIVMIYIQGLFYQTIGFSRKDVASLISICPRLAD